MNLNIKDKKALIVGASRGVGFALAQKLLNEGVQVCGVARNAEALGHLYPISSGPSFLYQLDLLPKTAENKLFSFLAANSFYPDIIAYCFGGQDGLNQEDSTEAQWLAMYRSIFEIPMLINEYFLPFMRKRHWGRIIGMSSPAALEARGPIPYCTFKAMLTAYFRSKGRIEARHGIMMSAILPGAFSFPGNNWDTIQKENAAYVENFLNRDQLIGRFGTPEEIADFMLFLCSDKASFNAGGIYSVDGGLGTAYFYE